MVPFSRIVPRLRRIVRQISTELNKSVELELGNTEGELDRNMMERMVAPLEHMLRNAIDHGIEDLAVREGLGKSPTGRIVITLDRDGSDVLVLVADDGGGIDINRVRQKAIERNLIHSDANLSDQEILQFILHAGFSTAETITQISGRGVGMDVVNSEIRLLGGSIAINSRLGEGTVFTIRVPFTVSVNRALMINMGEDRYAIPLNTIEGIVRVSPFELEHYYSNPNELFQYADQEYQLCHLSTLLDASALPPRMEGHTLPLPVILVRSADHSVAFQVDNLQGSREIVVKSLGPQFKSVLGVSGATIMGDGRVVVILDPNALIRSSISRNLIDNADATLIAQEKLVEKNPLVMVVDDSVTVRKVTTRLLEREGYDVITAKDGVDAISALQDQQPDIMLLDIEMPRMDGFEVAKRVRSSQYNKDLPIIMITSRTGEKHRQRGLEAGANLYMGKPYPEDALLESIRGLIKNEHIKS
jgi:chemosensory pili system protein ChpA (sensor histidine kinase/response regulator)